MILMLHGQRCLTRGLPQRVHRRAREVVDSDARIGRVRERLLANAPCA